MPDPGMVLSWLLLLVGAREGEGGGGGGAGATGPVGWDGR